MKKLIASALTLVMALTLLVGCGAKAPAETAAPEATVPDVDMTTLMDSVYGKHAEIDLPLMSNALDLSDADMLKYNTGLSSADKLTEVVVSEAMMGQPYSLVLVKVKDAADAAAVAQEMFDNIDQRKWICVEADTKIVGYAGDVVMLFMVGSEFADMATTETMMTAFKAAAGVQVTEIG